MNCMFFSRNSRSATGAILLLIAFGLAAVRAQDDSGLKARQLYYQNDPPPKPAAKPVQKRKPPVPPPNKPAVGAPFLGIRYRVLLGPQWTPVDPERSFRSGETFQLQITPNAAGFLYLLVQGSKGNWEPLFPLSKEGEAETKISAGQVVVVPSSSKAPFQFDLDPGTEKLFVVLSRNREKSLDDLMRSLRQSGTGKDADKDAGAHNQMLAGSISNERLDQLRQQLTSRGITRQHVAEGAKDSQPGETAAVYVTNASLENNDRVVTDIVLKHE